MTNRFLPIYLFSFTVLGAVAVLGSGACVSAEPGWFSFRGPGGMGDAESPAVTTAVDRNVNMSWRTPLKGIGWSSPVTDGKKIWVTSAVATKATEAEKQAKLANVQFSSMKDVAGSVELLVQCLDAQSGDVLIARSLSIIDDPNPIHPMNSYASPTPLLCGDRVICHFGGYGTWCLETKTGETIWNKRLVFDDSVGPGSSPVRIGNMAMIVCDGIDKQFVAALQIDDGDLAWQTERPPMRSSNPEFHKAYSTPLVIDVNGSLQAVVPGAQWIVAYDPQSGKEIWRVDYGDGFSTTPMPIFVGGMVVFSTGYMAPEMVAVDPSGSGDVTESHVRWRSTRGIPAKPSPATDGTLIYLVSDDGIASAVSVRDGEMVWRERLGGTYSSSPMRSGKHLFVGDHDGKLTIFETADEYRQVNQVDLGEQIMASPVPIGRDLLIRTKDAVYRFKAMEE